MHLKNGIAGIIYKLQKFTLFNNAIHTTVYYYFKHSTLYTILR